MNRSASSTKTWSLSPRRKSWWVFEPWQGPEVGSCRKSLLDGHLLWLRKSQWAAADSACGVRQLINCLQRREAGFGTESLKSHKTAGGAQQELMVSHSKLCLCCGA